MKRSAASPVGVGVISVITVLLVLTLSLFAALSVAPAQAALALSRKTAATVPAYYQADAQAAELYAAFAAGNEPTLEAVLPITDQQSLLLRLARTEAGDVEILAWQTQTQELPPEEGLPVWTGPSDQAQ